MCCIAMSPAPTLQPCCFTASDQLVQVWCVATGKLITTVKATNPGSEVKCVSPSPDGKWLVVCVIGSKDSSCASLSLYQVTVCPANETITLHGEGCKKVTSNPWFAFFEDDCSGFVTGDANGTLCLWDVESWCRAAERGQLGQFIGRYYGIIV